MVALPGQVGKNFRPLFFPQDVAIPVGPKVSLHTAETLERNIENELKENAGRPRYVVEWRHAECFFFAENGNLLLHLFKHFVVLLLVRCVVRVSWNTHEYTDVYL